MAYTDSAIDYEYTVEYISVADNYMRVLYSSADSTDGRPDVRRNFELDEFTDSRVHELVTSQNAVADVVKIWNDALNNDSDAGSFDPDSYPSLVFSERYRPLQFDSVLEPITDFNPNTKRVEEYDSVTTNRIVRHYRVVDLDSDGKVGFRSFIRPSLQQVRQRLIDLGKYDSIQSLIAASTDSNNVEWEYGNGISFGDPLADEMRPVLDAAADSDWSQFLSDAYYYYGGV